jgi:TonB family protein
VEAGIPGGTVGREKDGVVGGAVGGETGGQIGGGGQGDRPIPAGEVASPPSITSQILPTYPPLARAHGMEGRVVLKLIVDREGHVEGDSIRAKPSSPVFDQAAIEAVHQRRFRPGRDASGRAVRVILEVPIRFQLR